MKTYVMTEKEVGELAAKRINAGITYAVEVPNTYTRALIATTVSELSAAGKTDKAVQLSQLDIVHRRFYDAIVKVASKIPLTDKSVDRDQAINARSGFARSAHSTVRNWLLRGESLLTKINVSTVTKRLLYEQTPRRERAGPPRVNSKRLVTASQKLLESVMRIAEVNREDAVTALMDVINALTRGFDDLGIPSMAIREAVEHTATTIVEPIATTAKRKLRAAA